MTIPTCCGSDLVLGVASDASCSAPSPDCSGLGCPKNVYDQTEDGATVEPGYALALRCDYSIHPSLSQGLCRTYRVPFPDCGGTRCAEGQVCVHLPPSGGGAGPQCVPMPDSGTCPDGFQPDSCGCSEIPVTPPPFCEEISAGCGAVPTCDCFPTEICGGGPNLCVGVSGLDVQCANLAP
ncbi:MAG: hypothetical protein FJ104_07765 [Deltaproteobacteria bacterium]|nr:hypothetical protein [Deltaproteobacteria bacterium]